MPIFENNLADYIMPDVTWTGGITELKKIATMAEAYYVPISPHDASGPINVISGAQVMMGVPNFYKLETNKYDLSGYDMMIDHPLDVRNGDLYRGALAAGHRNIKVMNLMSLGPYEEPQGTYAPSVMF